MIVRSVLFLPLLGLAGCTFDWSHRAVDAGSDAAREASSPQDDAGSPASDAGGARDGGHQDASDDLDGDTADTGAPCADECTESTTQCSTSDGGPPSTRECVEQPGGCTSWQRLNQCGDNQRCDVADGGAACDCVASTCTAVGTVCESTGTVATCAKDANGCLYVASREECVAPQSCSGSAPAAACSLTCSDSCAAGDTACVGGKLATCVLGSFGCWAYGTPEACGARQSCVGTSGTASCDCNHDAVCTKAGATCDVSSVVTCAADAQGCFYQSATSGCSGGKQCSGGACACSGGTTDCHGTCVNTSNDADNCGSCDHDCGNGTCSASRCVAFKLANTVLTGRMLLDATAVYGTTTHAVAIDIQSGTVLATGVPATSAGLWTASATAVFAVDDRGNPAYRFDKSTLSASAFLDSGGYGVWNDGALSTNYLWVWSQGQGSIVDTLAAYDPATGYAHGDPTFGSAGCEAIAADDLGLVFAASEYDSNIGAGKPCALTATSPSGSNVRTLSAPATIKPTVMTIDQSTAYWYDATTKLLYASPRDGSGYRVLINTALAHPPVQLAVDATHVYWTDSVAGTVSKVARSASGAAAQQVASGQTGASGIVVNAQALYWATSSGLMKLVK